MAMTRSGSGGLLLDTHVLLWHLEDNPRLGPLSRGLITSSGTVSYSAASLWEVTIKSMLGKITLPDAFDAGLHSTGLSELSVEGEHTRAIAQFPALIGHDPFDQLLLAQAGITARTFITADQVLLDLGLPFVADARR